MNAKKINKIDNLKIINELKTFPNQAFIWSIMGKDNPQYIWQLPSTKSIMIMEPNCNDPFVFLAGELDVRDIDEVIKLCPLEYPRIFCDNLYHPMFLKKGWDFHLRAELSYTTSNQRIELDHGWEFKNLNNMDLLQQCYYYKKVPQQFSDLELFFRSNKAYVLCHQGQVASEGHIEHDDASPYAELIVATNPNYRMKGAAAKIAKYVAEKCKEVGLTAIWSCQIDNRASLNTALSAGFKIDRYYINMVPEIGNIMSPKLEKWVNENTPINWEG
jgi:GNAT superfamily N-acetyltransferase